MAGRAHIAWRVPAYLPYLQPPLTTAAIEDAERRLGLHLPEAYVAALREQNGGHLRYSVRGCGIANELWGIGPRFPSILEGSLKARHSDDDGWLPHEAEGLVPLAGDGHWYLCFDVREGRAESMVSYIDLESRRHKLVAGTFAELVTLLVPDDDDRTIGVSTKLGLPATAKKLGKVLRMKVTDQGDWAHGYATFHGRRQGGGAPVQFWLSPNEVRRGFVREDEPDYATLSKLMPGMALQVPEHPDCTLLLTGSGIEQQELLDACGRAGLAARQLDVG